MVEIGYALSCEEHAPNDLVRHAHEAEETGFTFALISDHFHPWIDRQGHSPFVWSVIGGIAHATRRLRLGTGVTCPIMRYHPAIVAQAAATSAAMMPGRFFLGVGSGENLNEHILGEGWPSAPVRQEMLEESIEIIRLLWQGGERSFDGTYFTVDHARLYTLPDEPPPLYVAASGPQAAKLAGEVGDGLIMTSPDTELINAFDAASGSEKPRYGQVTVCWAADEATRSPHRARVVADRRRPGRARPGAATAAPLRAGGPERPRRRRSQSRRVRTGSRATPRGDPRVRRRGLPVCLRASGWLRPGRLLRLLQT